MKIGMEIFKVNLTNKTEKELKKLPKYIVLKLAAWIEDVGSMGLFEVKKVAGYHDEPLKGTRKGQRSIRFSKQ